MSARSPSVSSKGTMLDNALSLHLTTLVPTHLARPVPSAPLYFPSSFTYSAGLSTSRDTLSGPLSGNVISVAAMPPFVSDGFSSIYITSPLLILCWLLFQNFWSNNSMYFYLQTLVTFSCSPERRDADRRRALNLQSHVRCRVSGDRSCELPAP